MRLADFCPEPLPSDLNLPEEIIISTDALNSLPKIIHRFLGESVLWIAEPDTWQAFREAASDIGEVIPTTHPFLLPPHPHADTMTVDQVGEATKGVTGLVAVGSGTINDIVKMAAEQKKLPYIAVATAASMNGYASGIAAILDNRLKTTVKARPPRAIIMDTNLLKAAPPRMTQAGLGDLISVNVSIVDWWLSDQLEGTGFDPFPGRLMRPTVQEVIKHTEGLKLGDTKAFQTLARGLLLGGIAMVAAASSSPASGGEHLISHLWDMEALVANRKLNLHGAQVGVTTCICAALYQSLLKLGNPVFAEPQPWQTEEERIRRDHGELAPSVLGAAKQKHQRAGARVSVLREHWPEIRRGLQGFGIFTPGEVRALLTKAGAISTLQELGISRSEAVRTLRIARDIRDRVTVLDLAFELGFFPDGINHVLQEACVLIS